MVSTLPASAGATSAAFVSKFDSTGTYQYSRIIDAANADQGLGVACDSSGNMYITGVNAGTATIKDQGGASLATLPTSSGTAAFVSKFDSTGTYQYSRVIDSTGSEIGNGVACDSSGNMYITGQYNGTPNIITVTSSNVATTVATLPLSSVIAAFVSKFDSTGTYQYSRVIDSTGSEIGNGVACDSSGNMYITGQYNGTPNIITVTSSNVATTVATLPLSSTQAAFVSKFNSSGTYQYSRVIDAANADIGYGVACDSSGNVYMAGYYTGTPNIIYRNSSNVSTTVATLPASTNEAAFVTKFDSSGSYKYSRVLDVTGLDAGRGVACDSVGNMYLTGYYTGTVSNIIKNEVGGTMGTLPISAGGTVAFMCKFNSDGAYYP